MSTDTVVTINGRLFSVSGAFWLSFRDVAYLAGFDAPALPSMTVRVKGHEGRIVHPGESLQPVNGMVFNVYDTSNA